MENKMLTEREVLTAIINGDAITAEMQEYATHRIAKIDESNAKAKAKALAKKEEDRPLLAKVLEVIPADGAFGSEIATLVGVNTPKFTALAKTLVAEGSLNVEKRKAKGREANFYTKA